MQDAPTLREGSLTTAFFAWLERDLERRSSSQRAQVEAAKLLSTLAVATAAAFVAGALQVGHSRTGDLVAAYLVGSAFLAVVVVVLLDRSTIVDHQAVLVEAAMGDFDEEKELKRLRKDAMISILNNDAIVRQVKFATGLTLLLAFTSAAFAISSLLA
jgi:hypothetical protein